MGAATARGVRGGEVQARDSEHPVGMRQDVQLLGPAAGSSISLHLDIDTCDVTLISILRDDSPPRDPAGSLLVHTVHLGADLDTVRQDPERGTAVALARPGQSIVILGGMVPHETIPVGDRGPRIISALCFRAC
jgi:hypothetical protein